ncbi:MAG: hypothetical protein WCK41_03525 [Actinomycetes bacterium]
MAVLVTMLALAVAFLGVLVAGLLRSHAEILRGLHDLGVNLDPDSDDNDAPHRHTPNGRLETPPGVPQPRSNETRAFDVSGIDVSGEAVSVAIAGTDRLTLLAFLSSSCLTCRDFWHELESDRLEVPGGARAIIVAKGLDAESESAIRKLAPRRVQTVLSSETWIDYEVPVAPYFILVDGTLNRVVGEGAATSWDQVRNLMDQALADAGLAAERGRNISNGPRAESARQNGEARAERIDAELRAAGFEPGDPRLYQQPASEPGTSRS